MNVQVNIKDSKEYAVFHAFSDSKKASEAVEKFKQYLDTHSDRKVDLSKDECKAISQGFLLFQEAVKRVSHGEKFDFDNKENLVNLKEEINRRVSIYSRNEIRKETSGVSMEKANIGSILKSYINNLQTLDRSALVKDCAKHRPTYTLKCGHVGRSEYPQVFDKSSTYKSNDDVIRMKILEEKRHR